MPVKTVAVAIIMFLVTRDRAAQRKLTNGAEVDEAQATEAIWVIAAIAVLIVIVIVVATVSAIVVVVVTVTAAAAVVTDTVVAAVIVTAAAAAVAIVSVWTVAAAATADRLTSGDSAPIKTKAPVNKVSSSAPQKLHG